MNKISGKFLNNYMIFSLSGGFCGSICNVYLESNKYKKSNISDALFGFYVGIATTALSPIIIPSYIIGNVASRYKKESKNH